MELHLHDTLEVVKEIYGRPDFANALAFSLETHYVYAVNGAKKHAYSHYSDRHTGRCRCARAVLAWGRYLGLVRGRASCLPPPPAPFTVSSKSTLNDQDLNATGTFRILVPFLCSSPLQFDTVPPRYSATFGTSHQSPRPSFQLHALGRSLGSCS